MRVGALVIGVLIALVGLTIDFVDIMSTSIVVTESHPVARSLPDAVIYYWTFFTHIANLGLLLVYVAELTGWRWLRWFRTPIGRASMAANITLVMVFFHVMLAPTYNFVGALAVSNVLLHYVGPLYYLAWWGLGADHGTLRWRDIPMMLVPGILYLAWALVRGAVVHEYPYEIINADKLGYGGVAVGAAIVIGAVAVFCCSLVIADKLLAIGSTDDRSASLR
jgi:hypothetical protein